MEQTRRSQLQKYVVSILYGILFNYLTLAISSEYFNTAMPYSDIIALKSKLNTYHSHYNYLCF